jgi:prolyl-tRNA synthetase
VLGEKSRTGIRYVVDPRVVDGTGWVTGANIDGKHVLGLVAGRDFSWDGTVEGAFRSGHRAAERVLGRDIDLAAFIAGLRR